MMQDLTTMELATVAGGNPGPGESWADYLERTYPGGEWHNGSYYPNGVPSVNTGCSRSL